jgi:hypothetical protein
VWDLLLLHHLGTVVVEGILWRAQFGLGKTAQVMYLSQDLSQPQEGGLSLSMQDAVAGSL